MTFIAEVINVEQKNGREIAVLYKEKAEVMVITFVMVHSSDLCEQRRRGRKETLKSENVEAYRKKGNSGDEWCSVYFRIKRELE